jgi:hypothetical protein
MAQPLFPNLKPVLLGRENGPAFSLSGSKMADKKGGKKHWWSTPKGEKRKAVWPTPITGQQGITKDVVCLR